MRTPSVIAGDAYLTRGLRKCQDLLRQLLRHEHAWPFAKPVDPLALNIPDYFDIIKHPMDLGTIKVCNLMVYRTWRDKQEGIDTNVFYRHN